MVICIFSFAMPQLDLAISFSLYLSLFVGFFIGYFLFLKYLFFPLTVFIKLSKRYLLYQLEFLSFLQKEEIFLKKIYFYSLYILLLCFDILRLAFIAFQRKLISNSCHSFIEFFMSFGSSLSVFNKKI